VARSSRSRRTNSKDLDLFGALSDFEAYAANFLYIKTKDARLVNLRFNNAQKLLWSKIKAQMEQNKPVRLVALKGRQLGCSTFVVGFHFWRTVTQPNTHSLIVAHDLESTQGIFSIALTMYESLPPEVRPMRRRSNKKELLFENPDHERRFSNPGLRSKIEVRTAGNKESGRGAFYHTLHLSEVSSYPDPELLAMSLFPTVPPLPGTSIIIESTAKGAGTWFHDFWVRSNNGETGFEPIFLPWFLEPAYALPLDQAKEWLAERPLDEYELGLKKHFKLTDQQIAFRRYLLSQHGEAYVLQEYPSTPDEAFLGAGMPVFDRDLIRRLVEESYKHDPVFVGDIDTAMGQLVPRRDGHLKIWEMPEPHSYYVIGVDSAYGVAGGSRTAVSVLKRGPEQTHVATYIGYTTPLDTVPILEFLGTMYNTAMITVEVNGAGLAIQEALSRFWPRVYQWRYLDNVYHKPTEKGGWLTTHTTKPILISHFNYMLNHGYFTTYDRDLLEEAFGFVYVDNERSIASAGPGYTDDVLMATMIASLTDWLDSGYSRYGNVRRPEVREPRTIQLYDPLYVDTQEDLWTPKGDLL
jgi:hypothetical protein